VVSFAGQISCGSKQQVGGIMRIGIRQKLIFMVFAGLFVTMALIGTYRYVMEQRSR